ncbi:MAG: hypothetical protein GY820_47155 [Gammaproteobacteria bacterium]|nr:hypothetical protein [Gammaproteobacteria bacterium]
MLVGIEDYKNQYCGGEKSQFARAFGRKPQNVTKLFKAPEKWGVVVNDMREHTLVQIRDVRRGDPIPILENYRTRLKKSAG